MKQSVVIMQQSQQKLGLAQRTPDQDICPQESGLSDNGECLLTSEQLLCFQQNLPGMSTAAIKDRQSDNSSLHAEFSVLSKL